MTPPDGRLFRALCEQNALRAAWDKVRSHYAAAELPEELAAFEHDREGNLERLGIALACEAYLPDAASLIAIPKRGGETRSIGLVRVEDRIVLTALHDVLDPLFERRFSKRSFAYRPRRSASGAVEQVSALLAQKYEHSAAADIDNFFDSIPRDRLFEFLRAAIWEAPVLNLLEIYLHMGATAGGEWVDTGRGILQGSPLSPLLSNIYLQPFDRYLDTLGVEWIRYADNFLLLARDIEAPRPAMESAEQFLDRDLGLRLNADPDRYSTHADGFVFLGFEFRGGVRLMAESKLDRKLAAIGDLIRRHGENADALVAALREKVLGWRRYYTGEGTREQMGLIEDRLMQSLSPWLAAARAKTGRSGAEWRILLMQLELPRGAQGAAKRRWVEKLLEASRPPHPAPGISKEAKRAIEARKREYHERKLDLEEILVTRAGTYLGRTGERLIVRRDGKRQFEAPLSLVRHITLLTPAVSISADLMQAAAARSISIDLLDNTGKPLVRIAQPEAPLYHVTLAQTQLASLPAGVTLARTIVAGKIRNQENLLRYFAKYRKRRGATQFLPAMEEAIESMERFRGLAAAAELRPGEAADHGRNRLFALEGQAAASYWRAVRSLLWWKPGFDGRERKGANDLVNSLLNYGYGILYSRCMAALTRAGLNPYIGVLHKPQPGKAGLLFDFVEEFRAPVVDRVVFARLNLGKSYNVQDGALPDAVRRDFAREVIRRLQTPAVYGKEKLPLEAIVGKQAALLLKHFEGKETYKTYVMPW